MQSQELLELDRRLRQFASTNGMTWVVEELDEAIALGVYERRELRQSSRQGTTVYDEVTSTEAGGIRGPRRVEEFVSRRPLTQVEQVQLMLAALRRVLVDVDNVAVASIVNLNDVGGLEQEFDVLETEEALEGPRRGFAPVAEIDFFPDEDSNAPYVTTETLRHSSRKEQVAAALELIDIAVNE